MRIWWCRPPVPRRTYRRRRGPVRGDPRWFSGVTWEYWRGYPPWNSHTLPETNISRENRGPLEIRRFRAWKPSFLGAMLNFGGVALENGWLEDEISFRDGLFAGALAVSFREVILPKNDWKLKIMTNKSLKKYKRPVAYYWWIPSLKLRVYPLVHQHDDGKTCHFVDVGCRSFWK